MLLSELFCSEELASSFSIQKNEERELSGMKLDRVVFSDTRSDVDEKVDIREMRQQSSAVLDDDG
jgi:hypothetical protein